jgi:hypothetical protein
MLIIAIILSTLALLSTGVCIFFQFRTKKNVGDMTIKFNEILVDFLTLSEYINDLRQSSPDQVVIRDTDEDKKYTLFVKKDELYLKEIN